MRKALFVPARITGRNPCAEALAAATVCPPSPSNGRRTARQAGSAAGASALCCSCSGTAARVVTVEYSMAPSGVTAKAAGTGGGMWWERCCQGEARERRRHRRQEADGRCRAVTELRRRSWTRSSAAGRSGRACERGASCPSAGSCVAAARVPELSHHHLAAPDQRAASARSIWEGSARSAAGAAPLRPQATLGAAAARLCQTGEQINRRRCPKELALLWQCTGRHSFLGPPPPAPVGFAEPPWLPEHPLDTSTPSPVISS